MSAAVEHNAPEVQPYRTGLNPNLMGLIIFLVSELALFIEGCALVAREPLSPARFSL